ncbi:MAG: hypothetical protein IJ808_06870 [Muribaculaceae bacterium]|nr:hypothetical protein [Muribaculaceae bacterium]
MNSNYLFPTSCKRVGWVLFIPFAILGLIVLFSNVVLPELNCKVIALFNGPEWITEKGTGPSPIFQIITNDLVDEIIILGLIISLGLIVFSKEKDEDEFVEHLRAKSLIWSLKANAILLLIATMFLYGFTFFAFIWVYMFSIFVLYIVKFEFELYRFRHSDNEK